MSSGHDPRGNDSDSLDEERILSGLETRWLGRDLLLFDRVASTNELASSLARKGSRGSVILAESQTGGRGRLSRSWESPPGGIWMSLILEPDIPLALAYQINMAVCLAACRAISSLLGLKAGIKWPNDILIGGRKVGGILMEIQANGERLEYAVVGVGINANIDPSLFPGEWMATSLSQEMGSSICRTALIQRILLEMERAYESMGSEEIYDEWRQRSVTLGRMVRISARSGEVVGEVVDLARDGALMLRINGDLMRVLEGDCIHLRGLERK
ncbi:biotin--[acetyl-CoA-carboxylase] ligase [Methanothrix sp.]|uniref:biotin--[acetyl-CoA-carboxylase] ligase n=1 Tax=Methanothrix sp. TaxID=90426 RepID=UPI003BB0127D